MAPLSSYFSHVTRSDHCDCLLYWHFFKDEYQQYLFKHIRLGKLSKLRPGVHAFLAHTKQKVSNIQRPTASILYGIWITPSSPRTWTRPYEVHFEVSDFEEWKWSPDLGKDSGRSLTFWPNRQIICYTKGSPLAELNFLIFILEFYSKLLEIENYGENTFGLIPGSTVWPQEHIFRLFWQY